MLGRLLADRYRLVQKIGEGGMGAIYKAVHTKMDRICAIKLLTALSVNNEAAVSRFKREAKMASSINNAHAVTIYDFGEAEDGLIYLAMEFIDGKPLSSLIAKEGALSPDRVVKITNQIAEGLAAAHSLGIVHRDLKPDNIMLARRTAEREFVKVLDFGIAKAVADDSGDNLTKTGFILGTPVYMSPEQLSGEKLDARSDIYSLAIIVYEMLSGRLPFEGDNPQAIMIKRITTDPIPLRTVAPDVSESMERAVMRGLARNRDARITTAESFAEALSSTRYDGTHVLTGQKQTNKLAEDGSFPDTIEMSSFKTGVESAPGFGERFDSTIPAQSTPSSDRDGQAKAYGTLLDSAQAPTIEDRQTDPMKTVVESPSSYVTSPDKEAIKDKPTIIKSKPARSARTTVIASLIALAIIGLIIYFVVPQKASGFTLLVNAPPGSEVFVNNVSRGVAPADGRLTVSGLAAGELKVLVKQEGFAEFNSTVSGKPGQEQSLTALLLPNEIDYSGSMVLVPAGEFVMGDDNHKDDEKPAHTITLPAFYIDKYEVTNLEYMYFCEATERAYPANPEWDPSYFTTQHNSPVLGVTFDDAIAYANWAGKRLPTEAEWEKAASWDPVAKAKRQWPWGDTAAQSRANIASGRPVAVGQFSSDRSPVGAYDMAGNASEWVDDLYKPYKSNQSADPNLGVMRGASFLKVSNLDQARTTCRNYLPKVFPQGLSTPISIRCAVSVDDPKIQEYLRERTK